MGKHVKVVTDHEHLAPIYTVQSSIKRPIRVDNHRTKLPSFDYHFVYEPEKEFPFDYGSRHAPEHEEFSEKEKDEWAMTTFR